LLVGARNEVTARVNDALSGYTTRTQNTGIDFVPSTEEEAAEFTEYVTSTTNKLTSAVNGVIEKVTELVTSHMYDRPLLRETGNRSFPAVIDHKSPNNFSVEFQNIGRKRWSGYMCLKLSDEYKNTVAIDYAPPSIPFADPGGTVVLTRYAEVPSVLQVNGKSRSWGKITKVSLSFVTRL